MRAEFPEAAFLLFLILPVIAVLVTNYRSGEKSLYLLSGGSRYQSLRRVYLLKSFFIGMFYVLALMSIVFQLMGISWNKIPDREAPNGMNVALCFDISNSMLSGDTPPSRLALAKNGALAAMENLRESWFSVTAFKGVAVTLIPVTQDLNAVKTLINRLSPALIEEPGTSLEKGIRTAAASLGVSTLRRKLLLVFTDAETQYDQPSRALSEAVRDGVQVVILSLGTEEGGRIPLSDGRFQTDEAGNLVVSRRNESLMRVFADQDGVDVINMEDGIINLVGKLSELQGSGIAMVLRSEATGSFFLMWAVVFILLSWTVRSVKWKEFF